MKVPIMVTLFAATTLLGACQKAAAQFTAQDEAAVRALFDSAVTDIRAGNLDAWAARFADDARFYPANSPVLIGRDAILAWSKSSPPMASFAVADVRVTGEGNLAYGSSRVFLQLRGLPVDTSKQLVVFRRAVDGRWLVQAVAVSTDLPLAPVVAGPAVRRK
jgi:uncharacterized protein (TIGR02246 family)